MIVTTFTKPTPAAKARAGQVAARCGATLVSRRRLTLARLLRMHEADVAYVIGREHDALVTPEANFYAHPGMYYLKVEDGHTHPLIRAVQPPTAPKVTTVLDGTLGMAGDALHLAGLLGVSVTGVEASPILAMLLEAGLSRMAVQDRPYAGAAGLITVQHANALTVLQGLGDASVDVVYLDPMFAVPQSAQSGFSLVRRFADTSPLTAALVTEAARVAGHRLVLKVGAMGEVPPFSAGPGWNRRVRGRAVDYLVIEHALTADACEWDHPTPHVPPAGEP